MCVRVRVCVCVCARARACVYALRIVSTDKILRFLKTLIIIVLSGGDMMAGLVVVEGIS